MQHATSYWGTLSKWGLLLCLLGYVVPEFEVLGFQAYVWMFWAGFLFCGVGMLTGFLRLALALLGKLDAGNTRSSRQKPAPQGRSARPASGAALMTGAATAGAYAATTGVEHMHQSINSSDWDERDASGLTATHGSSGPFVNIDGTPMIQDTMVDIAGKAYGDCGSSACDFGAGSASDMSSMSTDSFEW